MARIMVSAFEAPRPDLLNTMTPIVLRPATEMSVTSDLLPVSADPFFPIMRDASARSTLGPSFIANFGGMGPGMGPGMGGMGDEVADSVARAVAQATPGAAGAASVPVGIPPRAGGDTAVRSLLLSQCFFLACGACFVSGLLCLHVGVLGCRAAAAANSYIHSAFPLQSSWEQLRIQNARPDASSIATDNAGICLCTLPCALYEAAHLSGVLCARKPCCS